MSFTEVWVVKDLKNEKSKARKHHKSLEFYPLTRKFF